jgi:hypothetical protein
MKVRDDFGILRWWISRGDSQGRRLTISVITTSITKRCPTASFPCSIIIDSLATLLFRIQPRMCVWLVSIFPNTMQVGKKEINQYVE